MADEVKIVQIDNTVVQQLGWAREVTLGKLLDQAESQTALLSAIAKSRNIDISKIKVATKKIEEDLNDAGDLFNDTAKKVQSFQQENQKAARRQREEEEKALRDKYEREGRDYRNLQRSVGSLRDNLGKLQRATPSSAFDLLTEKTAIFGGRLTEDGKKAGAVLTGFSRALVAAGFAFGALTSITDAYRPMVESGLLFEGSAVKFARAAYDSGLGLEQFTRIAGQYSQTVSAVGEQAYSDSVKRFRDSSRQFGYFGMNSAELADAQTRYMEIMRESGTLFYMTAQQQEAATTSYLKELTALSVLQGKSRKELEAEQSRAARRAQIQLTIERIRQTEGPEAAAEIERNYRNLVSRVGQTSADVSFAQQFGLGGPTSDEARRLGPLGLLEKAMSSVDFRSAADVSRFGTEYQREAMTLSPDRLAMLATSARFGRGAAEAAKELGEGPESILAKARQEQAGAQAPVRRATAEEVRQGRIIDRTTERTLTAQIAAAETINNLKSAALGAAGALGLLQGVAEAAAAAAGAGAGATGFLSGIAGTTGGALALVGAAGIGYIAKSLFTSAVVRSVMGTAMPAMSRFLPPLTPALPAATGAAAGATPGLLSLVPRVGGLALAGGLAGGALGIGGGAYQAAYGQDRTSRMLGIGSSALSGAMAGAMFGPAGILIGGLLGGGIGAAANYFGAGGAAAEPGGAIGGDFAAGLSALNATITRDNSEIIRLLTMMNLRLSQTLEVKVKGTIITD